MDEKSMRHGAFSWNELITTDVGAAKEFYTKLLGWTTEEMDMGDMKYTVVKVEGEEIGGIMAMPPQTQGAPPHWGTYITVDDADVAAGRAVELGAKIIMEPTDIPDVGRFFMLQDPQGAMISLIAYQKK